MSKFKLVKEIAKDFGEKYIDQHTGEILWIYLFVNRKWNLDEINKYYSFFDFRIFLSYQSLSSESILDLESVMDKSDSWKILFNHQVLSPEIIMKYKNKINSLSILVKYQHWEPWMIYSLSSDELNSIGGINIFPIYQFLPEDFILENKNRLFIGNILKNQRITPRLIEELKVNIDSLDTKYILNENLIYKTDIGRDWFIAYSKERVGEEYIIPRHYIMHPELEARCFYNSNLKKVRVWYKDHICSWFFKKIEVIRDVGSVNSFYKRFPPSIKPSNPYI